MSIGNLRTLNITDVRALKPGAVYKLHLAGGRWIVVKADNLETTTEVDYEKARSSLAYMIRIYKTVCTTVPTMRMLEREEVTYFRSRIPAADAESMGPSNCYYVMPCLEDLQTFGDLDVKERNRSPAQKSALLRMFGTLHRRPEAFVEAGRIVIADIFVGNFDRFNFQGDPRPQTSVFQVANWGNWFLTSDRTGAVTFCGIDFYDPTTPHFRAFYGDFRAQLSIGADLHPWRSEMLGELGSGRRDALSRQLLGVFSEAAKASGAPAFGPEHTKALRTGLSAGRTALKAFCKAEKKLGTTPPAIKARISKLWF